MRHQSTWPLTTRRLKVGQYLFLRHGGKVVFFGRFVAILRALAAFLAGLNGMEWRRFLLFNALGAIVWAGGYGIAAYAFGEQLTDTLHKAGIVLACAAAVVIAAFVGARRYERRLEDEAERALPGRSRHRNRRNTRLNTVEPECRVRLDVIPRRRLARRRPLRESLSDHCHTGPERSLHWKTVERIPLPQSSHPTERRRR